MNLYSTPAEIVEALKLSGTVRHDGGAVVTNPARFRAEMIDSPRLDGRLRAEGHPRRRRGARFARRPSRSASCRPRSCRSTRRAAAERSRASPSRRSTCGSCPTTPRAPPAARPPRSRAGAVIFEIARSEMGYTEQRPAEYAAVMLAAAIREEWEGPFFLQGDHFQTNPKKMKENAEKEIGAIEALDRGGDPGRLPPDRHRHLDARGPLEADARGAAARQRRALRALHEVHPRARADGDADLDRRRDRRGRQGELDARGVPRLHERLQEGARRGRRASPRSPSRRARRTAASSRRTDRSSASPSTSTSSRRSRRSRARSTAWPARSSTAPRRCRPSTSATSPTTTAPRSTSRPTS